MFESEPGLKNVAETIVKCNQIIYDKEKTIR